jgi:hypothetical protein
MDRSLRSGLVPAIAVAGLLLLAGCGGSGKAATVAPPTSPTATSTSSDPATPSTSSSSDAASTVATDSMALTSDEINAKCAGQSGTTTPTDSTSPTDDSTDSSSSDGDGSGDTSDSTTTGSGQATAITSHGIVLVSCSQPTNELLAVDLVHGSDLWSHQLQSVDPNAQSGQDTVSEYLLGTGDQNAYVLAVTNVAATGLKDAYVTRTVSAINLQTGNTAWTQPLAPNDRQNSTTDGTVIEASGPAAGHREVVVSLNGLNDNSAFDADTGHPLWRVPDLVSLVGSGATVQFVSDNLALFTDTDDNGQPEFGAVDVATGKVRWSQGIDGTTIVNLGSDAKTELVGSQFWFIGQTGVDAFDITSGKQTVHKVFPTSFAKVLATPTRTVALVDGTLRCFATGDWSRPLWSVTAGDVTPERIADNTLVLQAQSGDQLLSMADGSIIGAAPEGVPGDGPISDGLQITEDGVFAYSAPT